MDKDVDTLSVIWDYNIPIVWPPLPYPTHNQPSISHFFVVPEIIGGVIHHPQTIITTGISSSNLYRLQLHIYHNKIEEMEKVVIIYTNVDGVSMRGRPYQRLV